MTCINGAASGKIETSLSDGEFRIRICNTRHFNAMTLAMWEELARVAETANDNDDVRVIVLTGAGRKAFVSGADISEFESCQQDPAQGARFDTALRSAQEALSNNRHPSVAVIQGVCMGGGMALAMACDLRYCNDRAQFRMPAAHLGLGYELDGIKRWTHMIGASRTADLFLTARLFDGHEAARIGFVHESFPDESFDHMTKTRIAGIRQLAPLTLRAAKLSLRHVLNETGAPDKDYVNKAIENCFQSRDFQEGQQAFMEKRPPEFIGK